MTKSLLASVLAATLAVTSLSATPVQAMDRGEFGRFLLGAGTLLIIGGTIANSNGSNKRVSPPVHREVIVKPRFRKVVPSSCLRVNHYAHGPKRYFPRRCLSRNMSDANRLPGACLRTVWTDRGQRTVFAARCLRNHGWSLG